MKTGKTLSELAAEIERQQTSKKDLVASTEHMQLIVSPEEGASQKERLARIGIKLGTTQFGINDLAHRQIGEYADIPAKYYDRMREAAPDLLAQNVNHWFHDKPEKRLLRTLDGRARALLSDRYRPLENVDLAEAVLPPLSKMGIQVLSCEITERRMYIKGVDERINNKLPSGRKMGDGSHHIFDTVSPGIVISNSEVGSGMLSIETAVWTKACTNLAIFSQRSLRKYHIGGKHDIGEEMYALLSDQTRRVTDAALWAQARDVVTGAFEKAKFDSMIEDMHGMSERKMDADPIKVVELTATKFGLNDTERSSVLRHLIEGGDLTQYGLFNAVTRTAEDLDSYDRATDFERLGGKIIDLPANDWTEILNKAA